MHRVSPALVAVALLVNVSIHGQSLSDDDIAAAVKAGQANKVNDLVARCTASPSFGQSMGAAIGGGIKPTGSFRVTVSANAGRIAFLAAEAKRLYKTFSVAELPEELRSPAAFVQVDPNDPSRSGGVYEVPAMIDRVVLKSKDKSEAIVQPETFDVEPVEWGNLLGGKVSGNRAYAVFPIAGVRELPAGEFDVVVITQAGERKCDVNDRNRAKLFGK